MVLACASTGISGICLHSACEERQPREHQVARKVLADLSAEFTLVSENSCQGYGEEVFNVLFSYW